MLLLAAEFCSTDLKPVPPAGGETVVLLNAAGAVLAALLLEARLTLMAMIFMFCRAAALVFRNAAVAAC